MHWFSKSTILLRLNNKTKSKVTFDLRGGIAVAQCRKAAVLATSGFRRVFLAQLVEQLTLNQWVQGSSPWEDTKDIR